MCVYLVHIDIFSAYHDDESFDMGIDFDTLDQAIAYIGKIETVIRTLKDSDPSRIGTIQSRQNGADLSYVTRPNTRQSEIIRCTVVEHMIIAQA